MSLKVKGVCVMWSTSVEEFNPYEAITAGEEKNTSEE